MVEKRILFIPSLPYLSLPAFTSIIAELRKSQDQSFRFIYLDTDAYRHREMGINTQEITEMISTEFHENHFLIQKPVLNSIGKRILFRRKYHREILNKVKELSPDLVLTASEDTEIFRFLNHHHRHIPLFCLQQGSIMNRPKTHFGFTEKISYLLNKILLGYPVYKYNPFGKPQDRALHLLWSKFFHVNPHALAVYSGNPKWDLLFNQKDPRSKGEYLLFATQPLSTILSKEQSEKWYAALKSTLISLRGVKIRVKVHPREDTSFYERLFETNDNKQIIVESNISLHEALKDASYFLTAWSSTLYDALFSGIPTFIFNPENMISLENKFISKHLPVIKSKEELQSEIFKEYSELSKSFNDIREIVAVEVNTFSDGKASERIAGLISTHCK